MINSCISILYLECRYVFALVFYYCYKVVSSCLGICWLYCAVGQCFNLRFRYLRYPCVLLYIFIYVGNTCVIVTGSCLVYTVNKELGNEDPASASFHDNWCRKWGSIAQQQV